MNNVIVATTFFLATCNNAIKKDSNVVNSDTINKHDDHFFNDKTDWQKRFSLSHDPNKDSIWAKPVSYYTNNKTCSPFAIEFYYGRLRPSDNDSTEALLKLAVIEDSTLRPFYRWCLDKTIQIQDGALAEYTGIPARQYAEKFPEEFLNYMDSDTTGTKYESWVGAISYSGYYDNEDYKKSQQIREKLITAMKLNCKKFADKCFGINLD